MLLREKFAPVPLFMPYYQCVLNVMQTIKELKLLTLKACYCIVVFPLAQITFIFFVCFSYLSVS